MNAALDLHADDVGALVFPFTHIGGIVWLLSGFVVGMGHLVVEAFDPATTIPFMQRERRRPSRARARRSTSPTSPRSAADPTTPLFPNVRAFPGGGAPKPPQLHYDLKAEIGGVGIVSGYGLTECPILSMARDDRPGRQAGQHRGPAHPGRAGPGGHARRQARGARRGGRDPRHRTAAASAATSTARSTPTPSTRTAGSAPATSATSTPTATSPSPAGSRTSSSARARTSAPRRSRTCSTRTPRSATSR